MGPATNGDESQLNILTASPGEHIIHVNSYQRLPVPEVSGLIIESSIERMKTFAKYAPPKTVADVVRMLSDVTASEHKVFRDHGKNQKVKTICVGIIDCIKRTWTLYAENPAYVPPLVVLPLVLKD